VTVSAEHTRLGSASEELLRGKAKIGVTLHDRRQNESSRSRPNAGGHIWRQAVHLKHDQAVRIKNL